MSLLRKIFVCDVYCVIFEGTNYTGTHIVFFFKKLSKSVFLIITFLKSFFDL
jgi:hypothetical protein